jgi:hypothetical protein
MPGARPIVDQESTRYATSTNFCRIFEEDMNGLYLLSFLLTAHPEKAELCFVSGLEDSVDASPVFKQWARSWARRAIIQNAVRLIRPRPGEGNGGPRSSFADHERLAAVLELAPLERFVYVMSVLEGYSDQDCSVLLSCSRRDVVAARTRAFEQIGSVAGLRHSAQRSDAGSEEKPVPDERRICRVQRLSGPTKPWVVVPSN